MLPPAAWLAGRLGSAGTYGRDSHLLTLALSVGQRGNLTSAQKGQKFRSDCLWDFMKPGAKDSSANPEETVAMVLECILHEIHSASVHMDQSFCLRFFSHEIFFFVLLSASCTEPDSKLGCFKKKTHRNPKTSCRLTCRQVSRASAQLPAASATGLGPCSASQPLLPPASASNAFLQATV